VDEEMGFFGQFCWDMDQPWTKPLRDGTYSSMALHVRDTSCRASGCESILIGSMNGGESVTIASNPDAIPIG